MLLWGLVRSVPGISLTMLARRVGLETSSANWHLRKLADAGLVSGERHGTHRIFFAASTPPPVRDAARAAHSLEGEQARAVLASVVAGGLVATRRVAEGVGLDVAQARHQLNRLRRHGLLERLETPQGHLHRPSAVAVDALALARAYDEAMDPQDPRASLDALDPALERALLDELERTGDGAGVGSAA